MQAKAQRVLLVRPLRRILLDECCVAYCWTNVAPHTLVIPTEVEGSALSRQDHNYYVYLVASRSHVLYCGMTNSIRRRIEEHRSATIEGFTATYRCNRLVWFEHFQYVHNAIDREKQIKCWRREKKLMLIEQTNPTWTDLSEVWREENADPSTALRSGRDDKT